MKHYNKMFFVSLMVALASQVNISLFNSDFIVSAGIILFVVFLYNYEDDLKPIHTGLLSGIMVYFLRVIMFYLLNRSFDNTVITYLPEVMFYISYSIIYSFFINRVSKENLNFVFLVLVICDFGANIIEVVLRSIMVSSSFIIEASITLLIVSVIRSAVVWLILTTFKYYGMLLLKTEHENRYKRLLWLTSQLKSELYWIEKNMDNIEKVMTESYQLFEKINSNQDIESWATRSLNIARDVHEIKKENGLVVRGIKEITESELQDKGMNYKDIINILSETMKREVKRINKDIKLEYKVSENFYTSKHYYLMSVLRNLVMNSMDAIPNTQLGAKIQINHEVDDKNHIFIVSDNGSGIDEEGLSHIFSPGFSTKINYSTGEINRGLGLSIVKYLVEDQLGGEIKVKSKVCEGTSFYIYLPKLTLEDELDENIHS